jgi:ABC-type nickel/cobalt efflux system permease component RcnA
MKAFRSQTPHAAPRSLRRIAALAGVTIALLPGAALAQDSAISPDSDRVMIWTAIVSILALIACAIGYAWRRMQGMDHPTPDELEMMGAHGHDEHDEHEAVPTHPESEHTPAAAHH